MKKLNYKLKKDWSNKRIYICDLNLKSSIKLIWLCLRNHPVVIISDGSTFPIVRQFLSILRKKLCGYKSCVHVFDLIHKNSRETLENWLYRFPDLFSKFERFQNLWYKFESANAFFTNPAYAFAYKHEVCSHTNSVLTKVARISWLIKNYEFKDFVFVGCSDELIKISQSEIFKYDPPLQTNWAISNNILNLICAIFLAVYNFIYIIKNTRLAKQDEKFHANGADIVCFDYRFLPVLQDIANSDSNLELVFRNRSQLHNSNRWSAVSSISRTFQKDGYLKLSDLGQLIRLVIRHYLDMSNQLIWMPPELFFQIAKFAYYEILYRAFFNLHRYERFFCRDDYNSSHIIRTNVLRERNIQALGVAHGLPVPEGNQPFWRYLDFDIYFCISPIFYDLIYKETWPKNMRIIPIGSYSLRDQHRQNLQLTRPNDVAILASAEPENDKYLQAITELAHAFPERTFFIKHKRSTVDENPSRPSSRVFNMQGENFDWKPPKNVKQVNTNIYDLAATVSYAITSRNSTTTVEALQMGLCTFVLDVSGTSSFWDRIPNLCYCRAADLISFITAIENGTQKFPWQEFNRLIEPSGLPSADIIRREISLNSELELLGSDQHMKN